MNKEDFLFNKLHPICTDLVKTPNKHKLNNYYETIKTLIANDDHSAVNNMDEYLYIPMLTVLKDHAKTLDIDSYEYIYLTLAMIVKSCRLKKPTLFQHILNLITYNNEFMRKKKVSEEYTRSYFGLIREMIVSSNSDVLVRFFTLANMATIGLLVSTFVDCLCADESSLSLRLQSVDLLNVLINHDDNGAVNIDLLSSIFTSFLPGITIGIVQRFLMKANINLLNHRIICECLGFLSKFLCLVLNDTQFSVECSDDKQFKPTKPADLNLNDKLKDMVIDKHANKEWQDKTQKNLNVLLGSLLGLLKSHDSWAIRLGLVDLLSNLIDQCPTFFIHTAPHDVYFNLFLNLFIEYNGCVDDNDDDRKIKSRSFMCLNRLKALKTQDLFSTCLNGLNDIIAKTPIAANKHSHLKLINGYLAYLSCGFDEKKFFFTNTDSLVGLENALIACVQFDYKNLNNLIQINTNMDDYTDGFDYANQLGSYRQLKAFLNDDRIYGHLEAICHVLGHNEIVSRMLIDCLIYANTSGDFKLTERLFLVNLIVLGSNVTANNDDLIENLMGYLISIDNERSTNVTSAYMAVDKQNEMIILKCIVLETILNCSRLLSKNTANKFLIHTLSFILVSYMNENSHVKLCSIKCLHELSRNFNEPCPEALLAHNYDYVISHLLVDLTDKLSHQTLCILCSLCDICDSTLNVHLERILNLVLYKLEFLLGLTSSDDLLLMLLRFLVRLSVAYERWFHEANHMAIESAKERSLCKSIESGTFKRTIVDLKRSIVDYKDELDECQATTTDDVQNDDDNQTDDNQVDSGDKAEARVESHVKIQSQILDKCQHMISHPNEQLRLLTVDLIRNLALNLHENKTSLLPMVHKLWSPICKRFAHDKNAFIRTKIFNLVFNLSKISGDFIRDRFLRDLLPYINEFMAKQSLASFNHKQRNDTTYTFTNEFKMQCEVLMRIHDMCIFMDIKQYALESVIENILLGYLDRHQPARLQELALRSLEVFAKFDPDLVWLCLHYIIPFGNLKDHILKPTDEVFSLIESLAYTDKIGLKFNLAFEQPILVSLLKVFAGL
jgi:hypothetical protein